MRHHPARPWTLVFPLAILSSPAFAEPAAPRERLAELRQRNELLEAERAVLEQEAALKTAPIEHLRHHLEARLALDAAQTELATLASPIEHPLEPLREGVLELSERQVRLGEVITIDSAEQTVSELAYFDNVNTKLPIFLVIGYCRGGSVQGGYQIIEAMRASRAPVYVVVASMAASMAAVITAAAKRSYALPSAEFVHHELHYEGSGNVSEHDTAQRQAREWQRRLHALFLPRLGLTSEEFVRAMRVHDPRGEWHEFADRAQQLGWVGQLVRGVRDRSVRARPEATPTTKEEKKTPSAQLPPARPFELWFLAR